MNEEMDMTDEIVGGNVFEFTTEIMNLASSKSKLARTLPGWITTDLTVLL